MFCLYGVRFNSVASFVWRFAGLKTMSSGIWHYRWVTTTFNDLIEKQRTTILSHVGSYSLNDLRRTEFHSYGGEHFQALQCLLATLFPVTFLCIWNNKFVGYTSCHHKRARHISSGCAPGNFIFLCLLNAKFIQYAVVKYLIFIHETDERN